MRWVLVDCEVLRALRVVTLVWWSGRSGLVHGVTAVQKAESVALGNGSSVRGGSRLEADGATHLVGKAERSGLTERERLNGKPGVKYVLCSCSSLPNN